MTNMWLRTPKVQSYRFILVVIPGEHFEAFGIDMISMNHPYFNEMPANDR